MTPRAARAAAAARAAGPAAAAAVALAALTGCDPAPTAPAPAATPVAPAGSAAPSPATPTGTAGNPGSPDPRAAQSGPASLRALLDAGHPAGTGPQVALRFLQALQRGEHLAAARELFAPDRDRLARSGPDTLHRVLEDVAANAGLTAAGPCTHAQRNDTRSAVVTCGRRKVVVHVLDRVGLGVHISARHPAGDDYPGAHTHAYTRLPLGSATLRPSYPAGPARLRLRARAERTGQSLPDLADTIGLPLRTLNRVLAAGWLGAATADRVAVALGAHPCELWSDWFDPTNPPRPTRPARPAGPAARGSGIGKDSA